MWCGYIIDFYPSYDAGDYNFEVLYTSATGNYTQSVNLRNLRLNLTPPQDGVSNNTVLLADGTSNITLAIGSGDIVEDLKTSSQFSFYQAFSDVHHSLDFGGGVIIPGLHTLTNLALNGNPVVGGFSLSPAGVLTIDSNNLQVGEYSFDLVMNSGHPTDIHTFTQTMTVNVVDADPAITTKTVSSTSPTTPPVLTKVGQQGLATRLDYQITEARGFKVHSPENVGDREELKKFIDANPIGAFTLTGADAAKFTVDSDGMIKSQSQIDYERQSSYEFELTYTAGGASYKESYFLTVVDDPADNVKHLLDIGVGTRASSAEAVEILNVAINQLTASRAKLGAIENRLTYNISNLTKASMLTEQASGRITDADFAQETSELAKNQILNQASMAMLSQANQSKQTVLQLLG